MSAYRLSPCAGMFPSDLHRMGASVNVRGHILYTPRAAESLQSLGHSMVRDLDRIQRPAGHLEEADLESERQPIQHGPPVSYEVRFPLALQTHTERARQASHSDLQLASRERGILELAR